MGKLGLLATASLMFNVVAFYSLVIQVYQTHNTFSLNWGYLLGNIIAQILLIMYGIANKSPEIYGPTFLLFFGLGYIVYDKFIYGNNYETNKLTN